MSDTATVVESTLVTGIKQDTKFKPGVSGNPSGRPKIPEDIKQAFKDLTWDAIEALRNIVNDDRVTAINAKVRAAEIILERGWGKEAIPINLHTPKPLHIIQEYINPEPSGN
jgi:hypothetical protein